MNLDGVTPKLTAKREAFIQHYLTSFNATQAAKNAGYSEKTAYSQGQRLLKKVEVKAAIEENIRELIADRKERQKFWTAVLRDENEDMKNRLRASELQAKASGDFVEKFQYCEEQPSPYDYSKLSEDELSTLRELLTKAMKNDV